MKKNLTNTVFLYHKWFNKNSFKKCYYEVTVPVVFVSKRQKSNCTQHIFCSIFSLYTLTINLSLLQLECHGLKKVTEKGLSYLFSKLKSLQNVSVMACGLSSIPDTISKLLNKRYMVFDLSRNLGAKYGF